MRYYNLFYTSFLITPSILCVLLNAKYWTSPSHSIYHNSTFKSSSVASTPLSAVIHRIPSTRIFDIATLTYKAILEWRNTRWATRFHRVAGLSANSGSANDQLFGFRHDTSTACLCHRHEVSTLRLYNFLSTFTLLTTWILCEKYESRIYVPESINQELLQISAGPALWVWAQRASEVSFGNVLNLTVPLLMDKRPCVLLTKAHTEHFSVSKLLKVFEEKVSRMNKLFQKEPSSQK